MWRVRRDEPVDLEVGRYLRELRQEAGLTLATVAFRAGVSINTVSALERGARSTRAVGVAMAYKLAHALQTDPISLFLVLSTGDPKATPGVEAPADALQVPVAELAAVNPLAWNPWRAASSSEVRYMVPRSVTGADPGGIIVRWSGGTPGPNVSVAARSYLGQIAPGWVAYLSPASWLEFRDGGPDQCPDSSGLGTRRRVGTVLLALSGAFAIVTVSELDFDARYETGYDFEHGHEPSPSESRIFGQLTWWAPR